jgi:CBS domain-containing membrane protein
MIGVEHDLTSHSEKWISALGAFLSLAALGSLSYALVGGIGAGMIVASMGASAVLLFVVPHGALSQPWPLLGGHLLSAVIGVACRDYLPSPVLAVALAVGLSILLMQYLRCVHPPGGATALVAVIGGPQIEALGYGYVLQPILLDVLVMLVVALLFNNFFGWRRYPVGLLRPNQPATKVKRQVQLTQEDFEATLHELNTFVDVDTQELIKLVELARQHAEEKQ